MTRMALVIAASLTSCTLVPRPRMSVVSDLSRVDGPATFCEHRVPEQVCTRHHPDLVAKFKAVNDWCPEHQVPESQCLTCHPELTFESLPPLPDTVDLAVVSQKGEDVPSLRPSAVEGKVTLFDFYADWCAACREIDLHVYKLLRERGDIAVRKLNVAHWDSPLSRRYLANIASLPYVVVYGRDGTEVARINGFDLEALDAAIAEGTQR